MSKKFGNVPPPLLYLCENEHLARKRKITDFINLTQLIMTAKRFYQSPETEMTEMPLEGIVCTSTVDAGGMTPGNPFSGNTEVDW